VTADTVVDGENTVIGWNRYAYCHNNPIIYKDPTGHATLGRPVTLPSQYLNEKYPNSTVAKVAGVVADALVTSLPGPAVIGVTPKPTPAGGSGSFKNLLSGAKEGAKNLFDKAKGLFSKGEEPLFDKAMNIAQKGNFIAGKDSSIFYSGPGNMEKALNYAAKTGKKTIEMTDGGKALNNMDLYKKLGPDLGDKIWKEASSNYAKSAEGVVHKFIKGAQEGRVYKSVEKPLLHDNTNVTGSKYHY
jgi:hypothetical protein